MTKLQVPYRGIIEIVASHDVGKTIAALQTVYPYTNSVFVDDDVKGDGTVKQMKDNSLEFGEYIDLAKARIALGKTPTPDQLLNDIVFPTMEKIVSKKRDVIIWDTWRIVYQSARGHVDRNRNKYDNVVKWQGNSIMIQGLISKVARMIELNCLNELKNACDLLIITHHLKDNYINNVVVGEIPESSSTFEEVCNMRFWLRRNPVSKVPIIIFLKRPSTPRLVKGKIEFVNIVPLKITPTDKDVSVWDAIKRYENNPIESRMPTIDETPNKDEMAMISGTLTEEQKQYMFEVLKNTKQETDEIVAALNGGDLDDSVPKSAVFLLARSQSDYNFDGLKVAEICGVTIDLLLAMKEDEIIKCWKKVQDAGKSK